MIQELIPTDKFGVFRADPHTGVLLDEAGEWAIRQMNVNATIFENLESSTEFVKKKITEDSLSEWWIMDHLGRTTGPFRNEKAWTNT